MKKTLLGLGAALALTLGAGAASASEYLFQWDDSVEGHLLGITFQDGMEIQNVDVGPENYDGSYGLWAGNILSSFDVAFNIFERGGALSDTWRIFATDGASSFATPFHSDVDGQLLIPLANAKSIVETGHYQTVYDFSVSNGDHYTLQFRSDVGGVPEPAAWALMVGGFGLAGAMVRRRKRAIHAT